MSKEERLKAAHTFNVNSEKVTDPSFAASDFLDPKDLLQVRYEMVRAVTIDKAAYEDVAARFGVSAITVRRAVKDLNEGGVVGLVPDVRGPRDGSKLNEDSKAFVDAYLKKSPAASGREIRDALETEKKVSVSKRTVERYLALKKAGGGRK